jgi:hypothetical protein
MKKGQLPARILSAAEVMDYVGGRENFKRLVAVKWLVPLAGKQRGMDYDIKIVNAALDRVLLNGWPPAA